MDSLNTLIKLKMHGGIPATHAIPVPIIRTVLHNSALLTHVASQKTYETLQNGLVNCDRTHYATSQVMKQSVDNNVRSIAELDSIFGEHGIARIVSATEGLEKCCDRLTKATQLISHKDEERQQAADALDEALQKKRDALLARFGS